MDGDFTEQRHPDLTRIGSLVRELLDAYPDPDSGHALPGLLTQAWAPDNVTLLAAKPEGNSEGGRSGKPGSKPPSRTLLDLMAHVQATLSMAQEEADDLGCFINSAERETALRRLPALLEPTIAADCPDCKRCTWQTNDRCTCRHRVVTQRVGFHHSALSTALGWQEPRIDWHDVTCPACGRTGKVSVRRAQERVWCRWEDCDFDRTGTLSILALAS